MARACDACTARCPTRATRECQRSCCSPVGSVVRTLDQPRNPPPLCIHFGVHEILARVACDGGSVMCLRLSCVCAHRIVHQEYTAQP
eukprot:886289-Pyramimonas_sp.AAC.1